MPKLKQNDKPVTLPATKVASLEPWMEKYGLSLKEQHFILNLMGDSNMNMRQAARDAGYGSTDPSQILKRQNVQDAFQDGVRRRMKQVRLKPKAVLKMLADVLTFNPLSLLKKSPTGNGWRIRDPDEIPHELGQLIKSFKLTTLTDSEGMPTVTVMDEVKFMDKDKALELAMKHCGLLNEQMITLMYQQEGGQTEESKNPATLFVETLLKIEGRSAAGNGPVIDADYVSRIAAMDDEGMTQE